MIVALAVAVVVAITTTSLVATIPDDPNTGDDAFNEFLLLPPE
jgi:hypothetical protein